MYINVNNEKKEEVIKKIEEMRLPYEINDNTIPGEKTQSYEITFKRDLTQSEFSELNRAVAKIKQTRHRKWDDRHHTLKEETVGWFTGKNTEEEVREEVSYEANR